jgi:type I restriction enzyme S subunit
MSVPKLRFPEFRYAEEWEEKSFYDLLLDVLDFRGRTPKKLGMDWGGGNIVSLSANNVKNGYIDFNAECNLGSEELYEKWMGGVKLEKGDIVFTMEAPLGNALLIPDSQKYILSQRVVVFKTKKEEVDNNFLIQLIWSDVFQNAIHLLSTGSTAKGINQKNLKAVNIEIPNLLEQKKIADCLSSIADRITAETQKLDTLKAHKKGLMQQLFPAEGETLPKLRFPEFQDSGEWEEKKLGDVSTFIKERFSLEQLSLSNYVSTENILPDYGGVTTASKLPPSGTATHFKKNDILISNIRPYLKKVWLSNKEGGASNDVIVVRSKEKTNYQYLSFMLKNDVFIEYVMKGAKGVKMPRGDISLMKEYPLAYPTLPEQQKIADCLTSIDEAIASQSKAIELLKLHKKGLMQQLFPSVEEVKG